MASAWRVHAWAHDMCIGSVVLGKGYCTLNSLSLVVFCGNVLLYYYIPIVYGPLVYAGIPVHHTERYIMSFDVFNSSRLFT